MPDLASKISTNSHLQTQCFVVLVHSCSAFIRRGRTLSQFTAAACFCFQNGAKTSQQKTLSRRRSMVPRLLSTEPCHDVDLMVLYEAWSHLRNPGVAALEEQRDVQ